MNNNITENFLLLNTLTVKYLLVNTSQTDDLRVNKPNLQIYLKVRHVIFYNYC